MCNVEFSRTEREYLKGVGFWEMPTEKEKYIRTPICRMIFNEKTGSITAEPSEWFCIGEAFEWVRNLRIVNEVYISTYLSFEERRYIRKTISKNTFIEGTGRSWMYRIEENIENGEWETLLRNIKLVNGFEKNHGE